MEWAQSSAAAAPETDRRRVLFVEHTGRVWLILNPEVTCIVWVELINSPIQHHDGDLSFSLVSFGAGCSPRWDL